MEGDSGLDGNDPTEEEIEDAERQRLESLEAFADQMYQQACVNLADSMERAALLPTMAMLKGPDALRRFAAELRTQGKKVLEPLEEKRQ